MLIPQRRINIDAWSRIGDPVSNALQKHPNDVLSFSPSRSQVGANPPADHCLDRASLASALEQLHRLLEDYAPTWYTEKHHETARAVLEALRKD